MVSTASPTAAAVELSLEANSLFAGAAAPKPAGLRPMFYEFMPAEPVKAAHGPTLRCKTWEAEAALRMLVINLDPAVSLVYDELIVYGGAARNWKGYQVIVKTMKSSKPPKPCSCKAARPWARSKPGPTPRACSSPTATWCRLGAPRNTSTSSTARAR